MHSCGIVMDFNRLQKFERDRGEHGNFSLRDKRLEYSVCKEGKSSREKTPSEVGESLGDLVFYIRH
jgi:hypothetical protein